MNRSHYISPKRDRCIPCDECGARYSPGLLAAHKCPSDFADTAPNQDVEPLTWPVLDDVVGPCCTGDCRQGRDCTAQPCSAFMDDELQDDGLGVIRGLINAVLIVLCAFAAAYVITEGVEALRHGEVSK